MTPTFRLNIVFDGVDFDDDDVFDALADLPTVAWRAQGTVAVATATIQAPTALKAADQITREVRERVPSARPIRLDEDLVAIPDIASRVGVTREAVRNWANGTRHANFPLPRGVVGDAIRVWAWADVNRWLRDNLHLGDREVFPGAHDIALIDALFAATGRHEEAPLAVAATARVVCERVATTPARPTRTPSRGEWINTRRERTALTVIEGGLRAA